MEKKIRYELFLKTSPSDHEADRASPPLIYPSLGYEWTSQIHNHITDQSNMINLQSPQRLKCQPKNLFLFLLGNFSTITVTYYFKRRMGYYLIQVYFPDICVVALSWIVFWMDKNDMGNRMALGITTILTIMFLLGSLNGTLPRVSYPKALDWYLLVSFSFAFLSLVECMIVFVVWLSSNKRKAKKVCIYIQFYHHTQRLTLKNCLVWGRVVRISIEETLDANRSNIFYSFMLNVNSHFYIIPVQRRHAWAVEFRP